MLFTNPTFEAFYLSNHSRTDTWSCFDGRDRTPMDFQIEFRSCQAISHDSVPPVGTLVSNYVCFRDSWLYTICLGPLESSQCLLMYNNFVGDVCFATYLVA